MKLGLIIAAFVALAIGALAGWTRHVSASPGAVATPVNLQQASTPCVSPASPATSGTYGSPAVYATQPYGSVTNVPPVVQSQESVTTEQSFNSYAEPVAPPPAPIPYVATDQVIRHEYVPAPPPRTRVYYRYRRVHHRRPLSHSVAIVAGSAGTGAAIGALAGGGRGAGIGALAGGAGGFIYDRLTH